MANKNTDLLRVVANELKLPLINIQATASMLANGQYDREDEIAEQHMRLLLNSLQAVDMVDGILLAGRVENNQTQLDLTTVSMPAMAREVVESSRELANRYDRTLRLQVSDNISSAYGNTVALKTSLSVMLASLIRSSRSEVIEVLVRNRMNVVMITFRDEGRVISARTVKRIIDDIGNKAQPSKSLPATAGLGFYIATTLMGAMEGKFDAYTTDSKRSITFSLQKSQQLTLL